MMDINTKKIKKNAFRVTKERGKTASRVRVPGGHLNAQLLSMIQEIAQTYGNGTVHLTSRQGFEIPGIPFDKIPEVNAKLQPIIETLGINQPEKNKGYSAAGTRNEVLDMSKLESDEVVLEKIPFNLIRISREVFVVIDQMAAEQNIRIVWEKKEVTHWDLIGSPGHVKRVMMNILSNAVKYNRANGQIYISCREIPSEQSEWTTIEFVCRDTGIGMTETFQKHIFEPFAQEHTGSRTKYAGTGLGMAITKKLIEKMGGTITFESEEGTGTTFVIRVPFRIDTDRSGRSETEEKPEISIRGLHILLAEDNELNMEIAEFMLQNEGADVVKAWNGREAVEIFRKSEPGEFDVILMDIMMPVMNGYEATKMIRSLEREDAKVIPVIAMTANAFTEDRLKAKEAGMDEHIAKPVDPKLLVKVIYESVD